jgi:hypothetical protein
VTVDHDEGDATMTDQTNEPVPEETSGAGPGAEEPGGPGEAAPAEDARSRMESRQGEWMRQLQTMIDEVATQAAPVIRDVATKAGELAQRAAEAAAPFAARAADVTADVAELAAHKSREVAADIRRSNAPADAADLASGEADGGPAGADGEAPSSDEGGAS